jgi:hypothetical protein
MVASMIAAIDQHVADAGGAHFAEGNFRRGGRGHDRRLEMHDRQLAALDAWIAAQDEELSRPEAIRRLVEMALARLSRR